MLIGVFSQYFFGIAIFITSVFLILLVLVQRGRGGGLVGALGGPGGQSALGTKAGDIFTRITIGVAAVWIFLCASAVRVLNPSDSNPLRGLDEVAEVRSGQLESAPGSTTPSIPRGAAPGASDRAAPGESTPGSATPVPSNPPPSPSAPATGTAPGETPAPAGDAVPENSLRSSPPAESTQSSQSTPPADDAAPAPSEGADAPESGSK